MTIDVKVSPQISDAKPILTQPNEQKLPLWERLVGAPAHIRDEEARHRNRLLSSIMLVLMLVGTPVTFLVAQFQENQGIDFDVAALIVIIALTFVLYLFNRRGHTQRVAWGFTLLLGVVFSTVPFHHESNHIFMIGVVIPIFVAGMYFEQHISNRLAYGMITTQLVLMLAMIIFETHPRANPAHYLMMWGGLLAINALVITFIRHQAIVERLRRARLIEANQKLRESEALLEERVNARTRDLELAADISRQASAMLELDAMLNHTVERVFDVFQWYHTTIYLYDEASKTLRYQVGKGLVDVEVIGRLQDVPLTAPNLSAQAARTRQIAFIEDVSKATDYLPNPLYPLTKAEIALPMLVRDELVGVLYIQSDTHGNLDSDVVRVMTSLSQQLAVAIQTTHLYAQQVAITEQLREVDSLKSQFLASMSHELRTPLNAILNFTEFVMLGMLGPVNDAQTDALSKSLDSGRHLLALINDVLDITKIESGKMKLFIEENVDLDAEVKHVVATAETLLQNKRDSVHLIADVDADLPRMVGDRRRIRQILLNLVSNAVKFTEEGTVTLSVKRRTDEVLFAISDTGPGIPPEQHHIIFEPFVQTDSGIRHEGGTGLGLPITKRLIEAHHGSITLESERGAGASFYVTLPIASPELRQHLHADESMV